MVNSIKGKILLASAMLLISMASPIASANSSTGSSGSSFNSMIDRPDWIPKLPDKPLMGLSNATIQYEQLRKRVLENKDKKAMSELKKLADRGHARSLALIAYVYDNPQLGIVKKDSKIAAQYFAAAAKLGHEPSIHNLGVLYYYGDGVPKSEDTAIKLFELGAEKKIYHSWYMLGYIYESKRQYPQAIKAYQRCVNYSYIPRCKTRNSILSITTTRLKPKQATRVVSQLFSASYNGDLEATYALARLYAEGIVVAKNLETMVQVLEEMRIGRNSNEKQRKLVADMYKAYQPTESQINSGRRTYKRVTSSGRLTDVAKFKPFDSRKTILDKPMLHGG
jgi:TPR repeat protein